MFHRVYHVYTTIPFLVQRELGEGRAYSTMWRKYKRRVLLAMSSQAFAQLVRCCSSPSVLIDVLMVYKNGINGALSRYRVASC